MADLFPTETRDLGRGAIQSKEKKNIEKENVSRAFLVVVDVDVFSFSFFFCFSFLVVWMRFDEAALIESFDPDGPRIAARWIRFPSPFLLDYPSSNEILRRLEIPIHLPCSCR